jgi:hypothetical protein
MQGQNNERLSLLRSEYKNRMERLMDLLRSFDQFKPYELPNDARNFQVATHLLQLAYDLLQNDYSDLLGEAQVHSVNKLLRILQQLRKRLEVGAARSDSALISRDADDAL